MEGALYMEDILVSAVFCRLVAGILDAQHSPPAAEAEAKELDSHGSVNLVDDLERAKCSYLPKHRIFPKSDPFMHH